VNDVLDAKLRDEIGQTMKSNKHLKRKFRDSEKCRTDFIAFAMCSSVLIMLRN